MTPVLLAFAKLVCAADRANFRRRAVVHYDGGSMKLWLALTLTSLVSASSQDAFLSRFEGKWMGSGTVLGQVSQIEAEWDWTLARQFLRLTFRNQMGSAPKITRFEGQAYYRATADGRYKGMWFDNSGAMRPVDAAHEGEALVSRWGTPDTEEGETTYRLTAGDRLEISDRVKSKDGTWRTFGESTLTRQPR